MARSALFRKVKSWLRTAQAASKHPHLDESFEKRRSDAGLNRREILERSGLLLSLAALPACVTQLSALQNEQEKPRPLSGPPAITIIGAGLAGLTAAYELSKGGVRVQIFEGGERSGGRIYTEYDFNAEKMFCERGGEFLDTGHEDLLILAHDLNVPVEPLALKNPHLAEEAYFFGGRFRSEKELIKGMVPLAKHLNRSIATLFVNGELTVPSYRDPGGPAVKALDKMSLAKWLDGCKQDVEAWVLDLVRTAYVGEYGLEAEEQSAINLLILIDPETKDGVRLYGESDEAFRIAGGSSRIIQALEKSLLEYGVKIQYQHRLVAVKGQAGSLRLSFDAGGKTVDIASEYNILALPLPVLKTIEGLKNLELSDVKKRMISELGVGTNSKFMLGFRDRHWQLGGRSSPANNGSIFTDLGSQAFWDSSRIQPGNAGILANFLGGKAGVAIGPGKIASVLSELETMMPGISAKFDGKKLLHHWPSTPLAMGSYLCPKPGQYTELIGAAEEPELGGRLHFIGEYSSIDYGGYMNGAVSSAKVLTQKLLSGGLLKRFS